MSEGLETSFTGLFHISNFFYSEKKIGLFPYIIVVLSS